MKANFHWQRFCWREQQKWIFIAKKNWCPSNHGNLFHCGKGNPIATNSFCCWTYTSHSLLYSSSLLPDQNPLPQACEWVLIGLFLSHVWCIISILSINLVPINHSSREPHFESLLFHLPFCSELISSLFTFNHLSSSSLMIVSSNQPRSPMVVCKLQSSCLWCRWLCSMLHSSYSSIPIVLTRKVCPVVHKIHTNLYKLFLALLISCSLYISYFHHLFDCDIICSTLVV